jgi:hypothetical protein
LRSMWAGAALVSAALWIIWLKAPESNSPEAEIRLKLRTGTGVVELPAGVVEISSELDIPDTAHDLEIRGAAAGTLLRASDGFHGRAIFRCERAERIRFTGFTIDGNRRSTERVRYTGFTIDGNRRSPEGPSGLPGFSTPFARFTRGNGILALDSDVIAISDVRFVQMAGFAVLVSRSRRITIERLRVEDSGSRNGSGRNNTTGGILLEEGARDFEITHCILRNIRGNGIWTHSLGTAPQNARGLIKNNQFERIGRDAIQVGLGSAVRVEDNSGAEIGFPLEDVDIEHGATPVAIDTAGDTDHCVYARNHFQEVNGKCIDLDGFHHGEVSGNSCVNRFGADHYPFGNQGIVLNNSDPRMQSEQIEIAGNELDGVLFSGIFVIGRQHRITRNRLRRINLAHCDQNVTRYGCNYAPEQPGLLRSGIYLAPGAERPDPARDNVIEGNEISGFGTTRHCIVAAPGVSLRENRIALNICRDDAAE